VLLYYILVITQSYLVILWRYVTVLASWTG